MRLRETDSSLADVLEHGERMAPRIPTAVSVIARLSRHKAEHDLRPWWEYFLGMLTAAYQEFESRGPMVEGVYGLSGKIESD